MEVEGERCREYMISIVDLQAHAKLQRGLLHTICNAKQSKKKEERHEMKTNILGKRCV